MRIGIAIPVLESDLPLLYQYALPSVLRLDPAPDALIFCVNDGRAGLKKIKRKMYDYLFREMNVDVVLCVDCDMSLFPGILKYLRRHEIVDFGHVVRAPLATIFKQIMRLAVDQPLAGCLSIPRELWMEKIRDNPRFNGIDSSIIASVDIRRDFKPVKFPPRYMLMRRSSREMRINLMTHPKNLELGILKRALYLLGTLPI